MSAVARVCAWQEQRDRPGDRLAQESKSAALAKELSAVLDAGKLHSTRPRTPKPDVFYGALYFANTQLLVVSAQYSAPLAMTERLARKTIEAYLDLSSASVPARSRSSGSRRQRLVAKPKDNRRSMPTRPAKRISFDSDWKKQQLSEDDYMKAFAAADERYSRYSPRSSRRQRHPDVPRPSPRQRRRVVGRPASCRA